MKLTKVLTAAVVLALATLSAADEPTRREWKIGDDTREALVYVPSGAKTAPTPIVFAFHGHGGTAKNAANSFSYHKLWPEAIVVYPQGLKTPGKLTDPEGKKSGWQHSTGEQNDRDLKFFDEMLRSLSGELKVDADRVYATGHSNGGGFSYLLLANRSEVLAAVAPSAAAPASKLRDAKSFKPRPVMHVAGENDELVKFDWQKRTIDALLKLNDCEPTGKPGEKFVTEYASKSGTPVVTFIHPGTHKFPEEAPAAIVKFFKNAVRK